MTVVIPDEGAAVVSIERAAEILSIGRSTAYRMLREGTFPIAPVQVGKRRLYPLWRIEEFLRGEAVAS